MRAFSILGVIAFFALTGVSPALAQEGPGLDEKIDTWLDPIAKILGMVIMVGFPIGGTQVPIVVLLLILTAVFLTCYFKFVNLRMVGLALRTVRGKYSSKDDPGQITHFQALSTALSATVGLGNIAGPAIAIGIGGPGAALWMIVYGLFGMTSKFCECTLGVRYRRIDRKGRVHGGAMYYLREGLKERGLGNLGLVLGILFAIGCIGGAIGAGNMFQINQAQTLFTETYGIFHNTAWLFGLIVAVVLGLVIIGGIVWIARVTEILVPFMCAIYLTASLVVLIINIGEIPAAFGIILDNAFTPGATGGGFLGALVYGIQRGAFSNEAGVGSAPIAHSAVKTKKPASEGLVALLEPFTDTVIVCTATSLIIVTTGMWKVDTSVQDVPLAAHQTVTADAPPVELEPGTKLDIIEEWSKIRTTDNQEGWLLSAELVSDKNDNKFLPHFKDFKDDNGNPLSVSLIMNGPVSAIRSSSTKPLTITEEQGPWTQIRTEEGEEGWVHSSSYAIIEPLADGSRTNATYLFDPGKKKPVALLFPDPHLAFLITNTNQVTVTEKWTRVGLALAEEEPRYWVLTQDLAESFNLGIWRTSEAFKTVISWFPMVLSVAALLFAFSTMITWAYYGEQAMGYLFNNNTMASLIYKLGFCLCVVIGSSLNLSNLIKISDSLFFSMVIPNLIGIYVLLPVVRQELKSFLQHAEQIDKRDAGQD